MRVGGDTQLSSSVLFATSNSSKYEEAKNILAKHDITLEHFECELDEIQSNSIQKIALAKAKDALTRCNKPIIVDDAGIFIDALGGFPGPYSAYVQETIGNDGILRLLDSNNRCASFVATVAYAAPNVAPCAFESCVKGSIPSSPRGKGWGYDPIFVPDGHNQTFAEMDNKNAISHRAIALGAFATWFNSKLR